MLTGAGSIIGLALALLMGQLMESSVLGIVAFDLTDFCIRQPGVGRRLARRGVSSRAARVPPEPGAHPAVPVTQAFVE